MPAGWDDDGILVGWHVEAEEDGAIGQEGFGGKSYGSPGREDAGWVGAGQTCSVRDNGAVI